MLLVFFFRYFLHYSFLRPSVDISFECIIAAVIAIAMLVDFWIVFPYYCQQAKNYTTLYSIDGQRHRKRISLKDLEVMLHDNQFVRISRSDIVRLSAIQKCQNNVLILKKEIVTDKKTLAITDSFQDTSIPEILKFLQGAHATGNNSPEQSARKGKTGSTAHNSTKATMIQRFIAAHRDCKLDEIVSGTRIPKSTVTRYLKELQSDGLIEYTGSKKTGGYHAKEVAR